MKSIFQLIRKNIQITAEELNTLNRVIRSTVPENCKDHISVAGIRDNQLILITDSPVWASRLRLYTQNMILMLEEYAGVKVSNVRIRQLQPKKEQVKPPRKFRHLNAQTAKMIEQTADSISDPDLQQALYHLAKNRKD